MKTEDAGVPPVRWRSLVSIICNAVPPSPHNGWCCGLVAGHEGEDHDDRHGLRWPGYEPAAEEGGQRR